MTDKEIIENLRYKINRLENTINSLEKENNKIRKQLEQSNFKIKTELEPIKEERARGYDLWVLSPERAGYDGE